MIWSHLNAVIWLMKAELLVSCRPSGWLAFCTTAFSHQGSWSALMSLLQFLFWDPPMKYLTFQKSPALYTEPPYSSWRTTLPFMKSPPNLIHVFIRPSDPQAVPECFQPPSLCCQLSGPPPNSSWPGTLSVPVPCTHQQRGVTHMALTVLVLHINNNNSPNNMI